MSKKEVNILYLFLPALFSLMVYSVLFLEIEYLLTEVIISVTKIPELISTIFILVVFVFSFLIKWQKFSSKKAVTLGIVFLILSIAGNKFYLVRKIPREFNPKIIRIDPQSGIQGQTIIIKGANFVSEAQKGKVLLQNQEIIIRSWKENEITAEQPVIGNFGKTDLYVVRHDGKESNKKKYTIKNPGGIFNWKDIF